MLHKIVLFFLLFSSYIKANEQVLGNPDAPQGGEFISNLSSEPTTINPLTSTDTYALAVQSKIIEGLLEVNIETYELEPALAESYEIKDNGQTFIFKLREGVKWHDGKPLTVEDVKFSYDVIFNPKYSTAHLRPYLESIEKAVIMDKKTIKFIMKEKYFKNLDLFAGILSIIPKHVYNNPKKMSELNWTIIGTGPYKLKEYDKGKKIVLEKNKEWWGRKLKRNKGVNNFDQYVFRFIRESNVQLESLKQGRIDFMGMSAEDYIKKAVGPLWGSRVHKVSFKNSAPKGYGFVGWNLNNPKFQDKKVRRALAHLMNREFMNKRFRYGKSLLATGPWYRQSEYADPNVKPIPFDVRKGLRLLRKAGWDDSDDDMILDKMIDGKKEKMEFTLLLPNKEMEKYFTIYKQDLKKAGVLMHIKIIEWNSFVKLLDEGNFEAVTLGWGGGSVKIDPKQIWHSESAVQGGSNFIGYKNKEVDKLIDEARMIFDKEKRKQKLQKVYRLIAEDAPYVFMFVSDEEFYGHTDKMKRVRDTYNYSVGYDYWWIEK